MMVIWTATLVFFFGLSNLKTGCGVDDKKKHNGILPMLFVIGAQKAGTSSLFDVLMEQPTICPGKVKESHFFVGGNFDSFSNQLRSEDYRQIYEDIFAFNSVYESHGLHDCRDGKGIYMDATPLMHMCHAIARIYHFYPAELRPWLKFIASLREPVSRDWSGFKFGLQHKNPKHPELSAQQNDLTALYIKGDEYDEFFDREDIVCISNYTHENGYALNEIFRGKYVVQLNEFLRYFKRSQLLIINDRDAYERTDDVMRSIQLFLGLETPWESKPFPWVEHKPAVEVEIPEYPCRERDKLAGYYDEWNQRLYAWLEKTKRYAPPSELPFGTFPAVDTPCVDYAGHAATSTSTTSSTASSKFREERQGKGTTMQHPDGNGASGVRRSSPPLSVRADASGSMIAIGVMIFMSLVAFVLCSTIIFLRTACI